MKSISQPLYILHMNRLVQSQLFHGPPPFLWTHLFRPVSIIGNQRIPQVQGAPHKNTTMDKIRTLSKKPLFCRNLFFLFYLFEIHHNICRYKKLNHFPLIGKILPTDKHKQNLPIRFLNFITHLMIIKDRSGALPPLVASPWSPGGYFFWVFSAFLIQTGSRILENHLPFCLKQLPVRLKFFFITDIYSPIPYFSFRRLINIHKTSCRR